MPARISCHVPDCIVQTHGKANVLDRPLGQASLILPTAVKCFVFNETPPLALIEGT